MRHPLRALIIAGLGMACIWSAREQRVRALDFITPVPSDFDASRVTREAGNRLHTARAVLATLLGGE